MTAFDLQRYQPGDTLYLWWLANPAAPRLIGELRMARTLKGVSLVYAPQWLAAGFSLSEDLPLSAGEFFPRDKETAVGAIDDARPDRWGEPVIRALDKPPRLAVLDFLFFAGDQRFGALGVSVSASDYVARDTGPLPRLADAQAVQALVQHILRGESVPEAQRRLITPGTMLGGARPKALLELDGHPWVLKFNEPGESIDMPLVEYARLRRRGVAAGGVNRAHMHELFRRMVFNILIDNTDDHEKNHALLMTDSGEYELAPAFDVLPSGQALGYQQMRVGTQAADATLDNALSECAQFGLKKSDAIAQVRQVCAAVAQWQAHFARAGVSAADIASLAQQIDRPFLRDQRQAFGA